MKKLKLKTMANKNGCLGFIVQDKNSGLYYSVAFNDISFAFSDLIEFGDSVYNVIRKIKIKDNYYIYEVESESLSEFYLQTYNEVLNDFLEVVK